MRYSPITRRQPGCPHGRLLRLLARELGTGWTVASHGLRPWASANFTGARHSFLCRNAAEISSETRTIRERHLAACEWPIAAHIVADVSILEDKGGETPTDAPTRWRGEFLTVED